MSDSDSTSPERRSKDEAAKGKSTVATPSKAKRQAGASQEAKLKGMYCRKNLREHSKRESFPCI